ncbi:MAG: hypothetical protein PGN13_16375 [Patulibacter minatonensis]
MTVVDLKPDGTVSNTETVTGAASAHAALSDGNDASYLTMDNGGGSARLSLGTFTLPSGAVVQRVRIVMRAATASGSSMLNGLDVYVSGQPDPIVATTNLYVSGALATVVVGFPFAADGPLSQAQIDGLELLIGQGTGRTPIFIYEAAARVTYITKPVTTTYGPSGTVTSTAVPKVTWTATSDPDGGALTHFQVQYRQGATVVVDSGEVAYSSMPSSGWSSVGTGWAPSASLPNGSYDAYVRVAQTVNGATHWSDWVSSSFVLNVTPPAAPTLAVTVDQDAGRVKLALTVAGAGIWDFAEIERSDDGGATWAPIRRARLVFFPYTAWDWECPLGATVTYRVRRGNADSSNPTLVRYSAWVTADVLLTGDQWRLGHALEHDIRGAFTVYSFASSERTARQSTAEVLGRADPVVVSDALRTTSGTITFLCSSKAERAALQRLVDVGEPLLMRGPASHGWDAAYVSLGSITSTRIVDRAFAHYTTDEVSFVVVARPAGYISRWPT